MSARDINALYEEKYAAEPLFKVQKEAPDVRDVAGKHGWRVGGVQVHSSGNRVVVVVSFLLEGPTLVGDTQRANTQGALDNLLKGAATQCMQNLNLALGYDELAGVPTDAY